MLLPICAIAATGATILSYVSLDTILRSPIKWIFIPSATAGTVSYAATANTSPETQRYISLALFGGIAISYVGCMYRRHTRNSGIQSIKERYTMYMLSKSLLNIPEQQLNARELFNSIKDFVTIEAGNTMSEKEILAVSADIYVQLKEGASDNRSSSGGGVRFASCNIEGSYISHLINERCIYGSTDKVISVAEKLNQTNVMSAVKDRLNLSDVQYDAILNKVSCINVDYVPIGADLKLWDNVLFHDRSSILLDIRGPSYVENINDPEIKKSCLCINIGHIMKQPDVTE